MKAMDFETALARFEKQTCINPYFAADLVLHGVCMYFWVNLPAHLEQQLAERAVKVFTHNKHWRKKIQSERGPDYLRMFMRHWLAGLLRQQGHPLFRELPDSFKWGKPLPSVSLADQRQPQSPLPKTVRKAPRRKFTSGCFVHGWELLLP